MSGRTRSGGQLLVDTLLAHGADLAFCVPGESYLATLDALFEARGRIRLVTCRQEGGAANMAEATAKLTGRPGLCFVTRGPGAANAAVGVHTADQDATPMILFIGQVPRGHLGRRAFQEVEFREMFAPLAKHVAQIESAAAIPDAVAKAFHIALSGRPGPVVLALPEDVQRETASVPIPAPLAPAQSVPSASDIAAIQAYLAAASRPMVIAGGSPWTAKDAEALRRFAEAFDLPVAAGFRRQDLIDNGHPNYAGHLGLGPDPALIERVRSADLVLAIGDALGEVVSQTYTLFGGDGGTPGQVLIHAATGAEDIGRVFAPSLGIHAAPGALLAALNRSAPPNDIPWRDWTRAAHADYLRFAAPPPAQDPIDLAHIMAWLGAHLSDDAVLANGAGNFAIWVHRFFPYRRFGTQLAPQSGAMGYGVPAAIAAKLVHPGREVVSVSGDGCFMMNGQELATAVHNRLKIVFIVVNNGLYGTIRMHQERAYPGHQIGTDLANPDFAALARAYGAHGETVTRTEDFADAFARARAADGPALIELITDPALLTPADRKPS